MRRSCPRRRTAASPSIHRKARICSSISTATSRHREAAGLQLYPTTPCRVLDTRSGGGQPFSGELTVNVAGSTCAPSVNAQAYVLNATVIPSGRLGFLTLWPNTQAQPNVSTLNAYRRGGYLEHGHRADIRRLHRRLCIGTDAVDSGYLGILRAVMCGRA